MLDFKDNVKSTIALAGIPTLMGLPPDYELDGEQIMVLNSQHRTKFNRKICLGGFGILCELGNGKCFRD